MFKNFATREIVNVAMVVTGFAVVCCILLYTFIRADMMKDSIHYESALADTLLRSMKHAMIESDTGQLQQTFVNIGEQERVRHVRIFKCVGEIRFSSAPEEVGTMVDKNSSGCRKCHAGSQPATELGTMEQASIYINERKEKILTLVDPIYNEAGCSETSVCHYHDRDKVLLGIMEIGLSQEQLEQSLAMLRLRLAAFCVMILVLTVGGVMALLWRTVMLPLRQIVDYAEERARGKTDVRPPRGKDEFRRLVRAIESMAPGGSTAGDRNQGDREEEKPSKDTDTA